MLIAIANFWKKEDIEVSDTHGITFRPTETSTLHGTYIAIHVAMI